MWKLQKFAFAIFTIFREIAVRAIFSIQLISQNNFQMKVFVGFSTLWRGTEETAGSVFSMHDILHGPNQKSKIESYEIGLRWSPFFGFT